MTDIQKTTVAHILVGPCSDINFAHVVGELQRTLTDCMETPYSLEWKQDDVAIFDLEATRIVFAIETYTTKSALSDHYSSCLMVTVGPGLSGKSLTKLCADHDTLCQMIVRRVSGCYDVAEVIWRETDTTMTEGTIDALIGDVPVPEPTAPVAGEPQEAHIYTQDDVHTARKTRKITFRAVEDAVVDTPPTHRSVAEEDASKAMKQLPEYQDMFQAVANSVPDLPRTDAVRLNAIRAALYATDEEAEASQLPSTHTRLAAATMDVTMVIVCLPVGAAMLTYHVFKGGELRRSAQMLTVTGLFLSAAQSAAAHSVTAQGLLSYF